MAIAPGSIEAVSDRSAASEKPLAAAAASFMEWARASARACVFVNKKSNPMRRGRSAPKTSTLYGLDLLGAAERRFDRCMWRSMRC